MGNLNEDFKFDLQRFAEEGEGDGEGGYFPKHMAQLKDENKRDEWGRQFATYDDLYVRAKANSKTLETLGAPEKAKDYEFPAPAEDSGITVDPDTDKWFRKTVFGLKMPKEMAGKLYGSYNEMVSGLMKTKGKTDAELVKTNDELIHGEWGDDFDKNMKLVDKGIADLGGEDLKKLLDDTGLGKNPVMLKALRQIGFEHSESTLREGVVSGSSAERTLNDEYPTMKEFPPDRQ